MSKTVVLGKATFVIDDASPARTLSAVCPLSSHKVGEKKAPPPLYYVDDPFNDVTLKGHYDRGHLIAESLGGPNISHNVVPLNSFLNRRGDWKAMELKVDKLRASGDVKHLGISVQYGGNALPTGFVIRASLAPMGPPSPANAPALGEEQPRHEEAEGSYTWFMSNALMPRVALQVTPLVTEYWNLFEKYLDHEEYEGPESHSGPYHFLDFINKREQLHNIAPFGVATQFSTKQRVMILAYNAWSNMGDDKKPWIKSDDSEDPYQELSMAGCKDSPNIDHLRPRSKGGNNAFGNAQVVSEQHNSNKRAQYEYTEKDIANFRRSTRLKKLRKSKEPKVALKNKKWIKDSETKREENQDRIKSDRADAIYKRRMN